MVEKEYPQIKFIGEANSKRDFCYIAFDEDVRNELLGLLQLEEQLSQKLSLEQREEAIVAHIRLWAKLPDYYKSELADLTAMPS